MCASEEDSFSQSVEKETKNLNPSIVPEIIENNKEFFFVSTNEDIENHILSDVGNPNKNEKILVPILISTSSSPSTKQIVPSIRLRKLQIQKQNLLTDTTNTENYTEAQDEINKAKAKSKGVRFSEQVLIINNYDSQDEKQIHKSSSCKVDYVKFATLANLIGEKKPKPNKKHSANLNENHENKNWNIFKENGLFGFEKKAVKT